MKMKVSQALPVLGLDIGRVDADGTGELRERSTGHVDTLALHLETGDVQDEYNQYCSRANCQSRGSTHADFWLIEVSKLVGPQ